MRYTDRQRINLLTSIVFFSVIGVLDDASSGTGPLGDPDVP